MVTFHLVTGSKVLRLNFHDFVYHQDKMCMYITLVAKILQNACS